MRKLATIGAVAMLLLAACGGGSASGAKSTTYKTGAELADAIGCTAYQSGSSEMYVADGGTCTLGRNDAVIVDTFSSSSNRDSYVQVAKSTGGVYVVGDGWVVGVGSQDEADQVKGKVGGKIA